MGRVASTGEPATVAGSALSISDVTLTGSDGAMWCMASCGVTLWPSSMRRGAG
jgi:hypothetical protein